MKRQKITIKLIERTKDKSTFAIEAAGYNYKVELGQDYYQKLTGGKLKPEELVEKSFEFLLSKEPAGLILRQFDLSVISSYFPEYESWIADMASQAG